VSEGPAIVVDRLTVRRGGKTVLPGISLEIATGAITGLLGPSGTGKTTLIRAIVGVQIVESGVVSVLGLPAGAATLRSRVAYVTQTPSVYFDLTVRENLSYFGRIVDAPGRRIDDVIDTVGLREYADRPVINLSGGQRARVSLGSALLGDPDVLVLDEPTVGLDPVLRTELWDEFAALAARGKTLVVSSHVMDEAMHCQQLLMMREGDILAAASPQDLLDRTHSADMESAFLRLIDEGPPR
jgi:ABC-2 type transport system ATP-binding protein